ncbi:MAG: hypothetical protein KA731_03765 [Candidatus Moranbacteria bacterium]|nr:hypothetical protein [Candidatus Moranbacteria bacterium]MBP6034471.1 hypothetical protein [Candidatus Moranbacteria bacterium]MBP7695937.1 hypothetical protein [Candidatus Moranbacteria bacterium]
MRTIIRDILRTSQSRTVLQPALFGVLLIGIFGLLWYGWLSLRIPSPESVEPAAQVEREPLPVVYTPPPVEVRAHENESRWPILPPPPDPKMELIKTRGCVADGLLNGYGGDEKSSAAMINRSQCYYLHRALETWLEPPDFDRAYRLQKEITKPNTVYGMFIAEAIDTKAEYDNPIEDREFDFKEMCRKGSKNFWGEHTCKPSLENAEYRKYLEYITERAMDIGVQVFLFGQVFYQDAADLDRTRMPEVIAEMREYAEFRGMKIFIGAQTNDIQDEHYLRMFDFIEGGVGINQDGWVEEGSCFSRWWKQPGDWCWALLWHPEYISKANNVLVHLDWSGKIGDDMSRFVRMDKAEREETLGRLHRYFGDKHVGFLMPVMARLHRDNGGCYGGDKHFYSASRKYSCQDEDAINTILSGK